MSISKLLPQLNRKWVKYSTFLSVRSMSILLLFAFIGLISITRSPSVVVTRVRHDESTSNLLHHADKCVPGAMTQTSTSSITAFAHGSTYSYLKFHLKLALWVSRRHQPFAIVEDEELIDIFIDLNNKVEVPSRSTVSRDVKEIFHISWVKVSEILQVYLLTTMSLVANSSNWQAHPGKLHICLDGWTALQVIAFIGITVHWVINGHLQLIILDFIKWVKTFSHLFPLTLLISIEPQKHTLVYILQAGCKTVCTNMEFMPK